APMLHAVCQDAAADDAEPSKPAPEYLADRLGAGWISADQFWHAPGIGSFAFQVRAPWAGVKLFFARPGNAPRLFELLSAAARAQDASVIYFTLKESHTRRMEQLAAIGFAEADADVYVARAL